MRKYIFALIALILLVGATECFAVTPVYEGANGLGEVKSVVLINNAGTYAKTAIDATDYVIPGKVKILAITVNNITGASTECVYGLADATLTTGDADSYLMAENESTSRESLFDKFPLNGISIQKQLQVRQGPYTCVTIWYVQDRP